MSETNSISEFHRGATLVDDPPNMIADVADFHRAMGVPVLNKPEVPSITRRQLRMRLVREEFVELAHAMGFPIYVDPAPIEAPPTECDFPETADAIADLIYVLIGTAHEFGIPLESVWAEVQRSNMAKLGPDGKPVVREDGKITKPDGWAPPDVEGVLRAAGWMR